MRADNQGQGGILALMALALQKPGSKRRHAVLLMLGVAGAALFYGDGIITPAISVLSAIEGLKIATPLFEPYIVPITAVIVVVLFSVQRRGTGIGRRASSARSCWSGSSCWRSSGSGRRSCSEPSILRALNPHLRHRPASSRSRSRPSSCWAPSCWRSRAPRRSMPTWGISAAGRIRVSWLSLVFPALGAQLFRPGRAAARAIRPPSTIPFFRLAPALGALSAGRAVDDGDDHRLAGGDLRRLLADAPGGAARHLPRWRSATPRSPRSGQVYMPQVNWMLLVGVLVLVLRLQVVGQSGAAPTALPSPAR